MEKRDRGTDTHRGTPCDNRGRDWSDAATSTGAPRIDSKHQKPGGRIKSRFYGFQWLHRLADNLISDFRLQNWERIDFHCSKPPVCGYSSPRKLTHWFFSFPLSCPGITFQINYLLTNAFFLRIFFFRNPGQETPMLCKEGYTSV